MARQKRQPCAQTDALGEKLGQTILRLRTADKMSLGDLSESSGVAKSMISQIEKNEANPSLATLSRLSQALGTSVQAIVSSGNSGSALVQKSAIQDTPLLKSEDGLCELRIIGSIDSMCSILIHSRSLISSPFAVERYDLFYFYFQDF